MRSPFNSSLIPHQNKSYCSWGLNTNNTKQLRFYVDWRLNGSIEIVHGSVGKSKPQFPTKAAILWLNSAANNASNSKTLKLAQPKNITCGPGFNKELSESQNAYKCVKCEPGKCTICPKGEYLFRKTKGVKTGSCVKVCPNYYQKQNSMDEGSSPVKISASANSTSDKKTPVSGGLCVEFTGTLVINRGFKEVKVGGNGSNKTISVVSDKHDLPMLFKSNIKKENHQAYSVA